MTVHHRFDDPVYGEVLIDIDSSTGGINLEFERFEMDDAVIPNYRLSLTTEHVAGWVRWLLTNRFGRQCKLWDTASQCKRGRQAMLKLTEKNDALVYCAHSGPNVILIRSGCVYKVVLTPACSMTDFCRSIKEKENNPLTAAKGFVDFVHDLMSS